MKVECVAAILIEPDEPLDLIVLTAPPLVTFRTSEVIVMLPARPVSDDVPITPLSWTDRVAPGAEMVMCPPSVLDWAVVVILLTSVPTNGSSPATVTERFAEMVIFPGDAGPPLDDDRKEPFRTSTFSAVISRLPDRPRP